MNWMEFVYVTAMTRLILWTYVGYIRQLKIAKTR